MGPLTLGILECGPNALMRARYGSVAQSFRDYFGDHAPHLSFADFAAYEGALPPSPAACDAYLVTGSAFSVLDGTPWMERLQNFLRDAARERPIIGICFGHQLVAQAFGGTVVRSGRGWGVGVHDYRVAERENWMTPAAGRFALRASHQDQVATPPPGAVVLAGSDFCPYGMLRIGETVVTLQSHPEFTETFARELYEKKRPHLGDALTDTAIESLSRPTDEAMIAAWFLRFIQARRAAIDGP